MDSVPPIAPNVVADVRSRWPDRADAWLRCLGDELHELCARYDATPRGVLPARYGYVVAVDSTSGPLVMRASADPNGPHQARVAVRLAQLGVSPAVHETIDTATGTWMVLDEVRPGTPLAKADRARVTLDSLAAPIAAIAAHPEPIPGLPALADWLRERLDDEHTNDRAPGTEPASRDERRDAIAVLDSLTTGATPQLCHGDASTWNVLAYESQGWMLVDPRGMSGEAAYDVAVLGLKIARDQPPATVVVRMADAACVDRDRATAWMTIAAAARV